MKTHAVDTTLGELEARAEEVAATLDAMANPKRLVVMCTLMSGERSVGELAELVGLSPAALSQHLGKMRALRLVGTRRDGQTIYYNLASPEVRAVLDTLYKVLCARRLGLPAPRSGPLTAEKARDLPGRAGPHGPGSYAIRFCLSEDAQTGDASLPSAATMALGLKDRTHHGLRSCSCDLDQVPVRLLGI
jgi:DNA-binding transcriptional ArsR family regulator